MSVSVKKLIVGLGNPGAAYARTRHNAGFWVVEAAAQTWGWPFDGHLRRDGRETARYAEGTWVESGLSVRLLEPMTFMNLSGPAVGAFVRKQALEPSDVLVVCDEVQLSVGRLRLRPGGTGGGHHGLESVLEALGTDEVPRLRIGVGDKVLPGDLAAYVLARVSPEEWRQWEPVLPRAVEACDTWLSSGIEAAMNLCNRM